MAAALDAIAVYADWDGLAQPLRLGFLHVRRAAGGEVFEFEFDAGALGHPALKGVSLDPRLGFFQGRQHPAQEHSGFGVFADASPDRWGRMLMRRRLERAQRQGLAPKAQRLRESDFLLGVCDALRSGALRLRPGDAGAFMDERQGDAAPPFLRLRQLEAASLALQRDADNTALAGDAWLRLLLAPGGSLGGARPKANVADPSGQLWIAKFPSAEDGYDVGAWELLTQSLARACGLHVPESLARRFNSRRHSFLVKRFDRTALGRRLHFASAMTLTGRQDGDDASRGASYLEIARVLTDQGASPAADLRELWSRIVFNLLVSNSDDHLRNHGFILVPGRGWCLSPAYDMNSDPTATGLKLNISEADNAMDLDLALSVAPYFRVPASAAKQIVARSRTLVRQWPTLAASLGIAAREQERMADAFKRAG